jgi:hypothetical protein
MGQTRGVNRIWWGNLKEKVHLKTWCEWKYNNKKDLQDVGCGSMDWNELAQDRDRWRTLVNAVMNLRVPRGEFLD